ncbi:MAG: ADP compounds hydrolase NudE [Gammaproteobacteria bacterium]|nr:ADP compounds hydrolase NudE [Gammaproteobacteria bacterium]
MLPQIQNSRVVAHSRLFSIEQVDLRFSNGVERTFERIPKRGREGVIICAINDKHECILVREYQAGTHRYELVLPKGRVDDGESYEEAANRELKEEAGLGASSLQYMREMTIAPSHMGFSIHAVLARGLYPESLSGDEPEPLEVVAWPMDELERLFVSDQLTEARSIATLAIAGILLKNTND